MPNMHQRASHAGANGFTLIEMIVVLVILGLMVGLIVARGPLHSQRLDIEAAARGLAGALRVARGQAMAEHRPVVVIVAANAYRVDRAPSHAVPTDVALSGDAAIRFAPDGSSSGGLIAVQGGMTRVGIAVDWLTGRVRLTSQP
jgi:general secretion pathway protein H